MLVLNAQERTKKDAPKYLRTQGKIPAVFYGPKEKAEAVCVPYGDFLRVWKEAGESTVISLKAPNGTHNVLIYTVDRDPVTNIPAHIDFYVIEKGKQVEVTVPLVFEGVSLAVKELGGSLVKVIHEVEVKALPEHLPHEISVSIESLVDFDSQIAIKDLTLPEGVTIQADADEVVALVSRARDEEPEEESAPVDLSAIEVEKKGKKEEEGEGEEGEKSSNS